MSSLWKRGSQSGGCLETGSTPGMAGVALGAGIRLCYCIRNDK